MFQPVGRVLFAAWLLHGRFDRGSGVVAIQLANHAGWDFSWADGLTLEVVGAVAEALSVHLLHHRERAAFTLGLSLWKGSEVGDFRPDEQHCAGVRACCDTAAATDTCSRFHCTVGFHFRDGDCVAIWSSAYMCRDEAAGLLDAVE